MGHADQQVAEQRLHFGRCLLQVLDVMVDNLDLVHGHPPFDAAIDRAWLVLREVVAGLRTQHDENLLDRALGLDCMCSHGRSRLAVSQLGIGGKLLGHFGRGQFVVHQAGRDGAERHAFELGRRGVLRHHHAAFTLDGAHTQRPVATSPRKDDTDGALTLILRQRTEEEVDRQSMAARGARLKHLQRTVKEGDIGIRRDDVGAVGLHDHTVLDFIDLHAGVAPNEVGKNALVIRRQVLHQHERHAGFTIGGHSREKRFKGRQSAGRGTDTNDGKRSVRVRFYGGRHTRRRRVWRVQRLRIGLFQRFLGGHSSFPARCALINKR